MIILETLVCLMLTLRVRTALPLDARWQKIASTVILIYSMDVWLVSYAFTT